MKEKVESVLFILSVYSETTRNYLSVYGECDKFRAVCGIQIQNHLRIHGKNLSVHGENSKIHKTEDISVINAYMTSFLDPFFLYKMRWIKPTNLSRYCPFKDRWVIKRNLLDEIFVTAQWIYLCSKSSLSGIAPRYYRAQQRATAHTAEPLKSGNFKDDLSYTPLRYSMARPLLSVNLKIRNN